MYNKWQKKYPQASEQNSIEGIQGEKLIYDKFINEIPNKKLMIFLHGYYGSKKEFTEMIIQEEPQDYDIITYDLYATSPKKRQKYTYGELEAEDLKKIIDNEIDYDEIYIVGHSLGAATVIKYIDKYNNDRIKKVIAVAVFENFEKAIHKNSQAINQFLFNNMILLNVKTIINRYIKKMQINFDEIENKTPINRNTDKVVLVFGAKDIRAPYFETKAKTYIIPGVEHDNFFTKNINVTRKIINKEVEKH
jgi:predicted alpha/beta-fold hydrolase